MKNGATERIARPKRPDKCGTISLGHSIHMHSRSVKTILTAEIHDPFKLTVLTEHQINDHVNGKKLTFV